jgi:hypothetical protein
LNTKVDIGNFVLGKVKVFLWNDGYEGKTPMYHQTNMNLRGKKLNGQRFYNKCFNVFI